MSGTLDKIVKKGKEVARDIGRDVQDFGNPPSTLEQFKRAVKDFWSDEMQPGMKQLDATARVEAEKVNKKLEEFLGNPNTTMEEASSFFKEQAKKCKEAMSNSPVLKKMGEFLESAGELIASLAKREKIDESWKKFQDSGVALAAAMKEAVVGKEKSGASR